MSVGRRTPELPVLLKRAKSCISRFNVRKYDTFDWLAGDSEESRPYCFPCSLFSSAKAAWSKQGYTDLSNLDKAARKHQASAGHVSCELMLHNFGKEVRIETALDVECRACGPDQTNYCLE